MKLTVTYKSNRITEEEADGLDLNQTFNRLTKRVKAKLDEALGVDEPAPLTGVALTDAEATTRQESTKKADDK